MMKQYFPGFARVAFSLALGLASGCGSSHPQPSKREFADQAAFRKLPAEPLDSSASESAKVVSDNDSREKVAPELPPVEEELLASAELGATPEGRAVLVNARTMITAGEIVIGSCWDFIDALYSRAGFVSGERTTVFRSVLAGPYADVSRIEAGDWLYYVNHSFGDIEHSAVFVAWLDESRTEALMISYAGGMREAPARYKAYDLSSVYTIIRPKKSASLSAPAEFAPAF